RPRSTAMFGQVVDQRHRELSRVGAVAAVAALAQAVRHARAGAAVGALGPDQGPLALGIGGSGTAVAAHAAENDHPALRAIMLGKIEHHLIDRRAIGLRPATL